MQILDEILAAVSKLSEQPVNIDDAETLGRQAQQAAKGLYRWSDQCFAMVPVDDEELDEAIGQAGVWALIDAGVLRVSNAKFRRWKN